MLKKALKVLTHFQATGLFLYPLKTSENLRLSVFRRYINRPVPWNRLIKKIIFLFEAFFSKADGNFEVSHVKYWIPSGAKVKEQ